VGDRAGSSPASDTININFKAYAIFAETKNARLFSVGVNLKNVEIPYYSQ
jgi:hypothetical protein